MKKYLNVIVSVVIAAALLAYVLRFIDLEKFTDTLKGVSVFWFLISFGLFLIYQWLRALRLALFMKGKGETKGLFSTMCLHGFLNGTLPAWLGEGAMLYLLKKHHGYGLHSGAATLVAVRMADLGLILLMFVILAAMAFDRFSAPLAMIPVAVGGILAIAAIAVWLLFILERRLPEGGGKFAGKVYFHTRRLKEAFTEIKGAGATAPLLAYTAAMWLAQYVVFVAIIYALGYALPLYVVFGVYLIGFTVNLLPVKGVANLGTHEIAWFVALKMFGMDPSSAAALGFGSHILILAALIMMLIFPLIRFLGQRARA